MPAELTRIDCHMHYMPDALGDKLHAALSSDNPLRAMVAARPAWRSLDLHREMMDSAGVAVGVMLDYGSELIRGLQTLGGDLNEACEFYNRSMSEDLSKYEGRFLTAAAVDPYGGKDALAQLERSLALPYVTGIGLVASYDGIALDDPIFEPIFEIARQHNVPVFVHPSSVSQNWVDTLRLNDLFLRAGFGFLLDDSLCVLRMVVKGTFDKYPDVRFMFCQLGGMAPYCCGRFDYHRGMARDMNAHSGFQIPAWVDKSLREYLSHLWLDTHTQDRHAIRLVIEEAGDHTIVLGGDHPYTRLEEGVPFAAAELEALNVGPETIARVSYQNALALLGEKGRNAFEAVTAAAR